MITMETRFWNKVSKQDNNSCWEWTAALMNGYGWFLINTKTGPKFAHRVSAFLSGLLDNIDSKKHVLHKCDNPKCCNPLHLFTGTNADNVADRVKKGRTKFIPKYGELNGMSKLTEIEIHEIRKMYNVGNISQSQLAIKFNVQQPHISRIINSVRRCVS